MTTQELEAWLEAHDEIQAFMDYETTLDSEEELADTLGYWFGSHRWASDGDRFIPLGISGSGSQFAQWLRPGHTEGPIVFLTPTSRVCRLQAGLSRLLHSRSEAGGNGVLAANAENWAKIIAYAPFIDEDSESMVMIKDSHEGNYIMDFDESAGEEYLGWGDAVEAKDALESYRAAIVERFGSIPEFDILISGLEDIHAEFRAWVTSKTGNEW